MPYNLLILPLLGGYLFINRFHRFKFLAERSDGYHFLFECSIAGIFLLTVSLILVTVLSSVLSFIDVTWHKALPIPGSGVTALSFFLGLILPTLLNPFFPIRDEVDRAIKVKGKSFEQIFDVALKNAKPIQMVLKDGKVYVGQLLRWPGPLGEDDAITMLPLLEGYQDSGDKRIIYNVDYTSLFGAAHDHVGGLTMEDLSDIGIAVHVSEIQAVSLFNTKTLPAQTAKQIGNTNS